MNNNPFEFMQNLMNTENFTKAMKGMPNMDFSLISNMIKNNTDTITSTNKMASESMQSIMKRGADSMQKNATEMFNTMKEAISAGDIEQVSSCQQKYLKSTLENNLNSTKEIIDITSKSSREILDVVGKSFTETIDTASAEQKK